MNTKHIIHNGWVRTLAAVALLAASQAASAGKVNGLDKAMHSLYLQAHATIQADIRANIAATPRIIDEPGVSTGPVEIIAELDPDGRQDTADSMTQEQAATAELKLEILGKALSSPGLFGVYRYVTESAAEAAIIVVK